MTSLPKNVEIELDAATWKAGIAPPQLIATTSATNQIDVLCGLTFTALWTRPPITFGFSLSDTWAWLRYLPAVCSSSDLRLCEDWTTLDPHQKTILSGDWGVGFTTWFLSQTLGFTKYADTLWVLKSLSPGSLILQQSKKRGPNKSPDYIAEDSAGNFSVVECKGTQSSRRSLREAIGRGLPQKANVTQGTTPIVHSLVAGLYVPQFDAADHALLLIADPEPDDLRREVFRFSRQQIGRGVTQVALAKELALLEMPETASYFAGERARSQSLATAVATDEDRPRVDRTLNADGLSVTRDYIWERPAAVDHERFVVGIRFAATLAGDELERIRSAALPEDLAEERLDQTRGVQWRSISEASSAELTSPLGTHFRLELLER
jgi:hypothetical protein